MTEVSTEKDFFISYTAADKPWAEWIAWILDEAGHSVLVQAWDFYAGGNFLHLMEQALQQSKRTILVISEDFFRSKWTMLELLSTLVQDPLGEEGKLLPIRVGACELPALLAAVIYIDVVGLDENEACEEILRRVGASAGGNIPRIKSDRRPPFPGLVSSADKKLSNRATDQQTTVFRVRKKASSSNSSFRNWLVGHRKELLWLSLVVILFVALVFWLLVSMHLPPPPVYEVYIKSQALPADLIVDGCTRGTLTTNSPFTTLNVPPGNHHLIVRFDGRQWGRDFDPAETKIILVPPSEEMSPEP